MPPVHKRLHIHLDTTVTWKTIGVKKPEEALFTLPPIRVAPGPAFVSRRPPSRFPPAADAEDVSAPRWARVWILSADVGNQV
jgi:hypothetical protein